MTNSLFVSSLTTTVTFSPSQGTLTNPSSESPQVFQATLDATTSFRDYRFGLSSSTNVSLALTSNNGNVDLRLYRSLGSNQPLQEITASTNLGLMPEIVGPLLSAGEYVVRVNDASSTRATQPINYTLSLGAVTVQPPQKPELFGYNAIGEAIRWKGTGDKNLTVETAQSLTPMAEAGWSIAAVSDWNRDGVADLVWRNAAASATKLWLMGGTDGLVRQSEQTLFTVDASWDIVGSADWNQDGFMDLIWRTNAGDQTGVWLMGGTDKITIQRSVMLAPVPSDWSIKGIADFDQNGTQDILWRNQISGVNVIWSMGGTDNAERTRSQILREIPLEWDILGVADWDQDGTTDIFWKNTNGQRVIWFMQGLDTLSIREGVYLESLVTDAIVRPYAKTAPRILDAIGDNTTTALNLGTLRSGEFQDWIGERDGTDLYQFNLTERTRISINLNALPQGTEIVLLDSNGQAIPVVPNQTPTMTESLEAGQYYIQVKSTNSTLSTYTLSVDAFGLETWLGDIGDGGLRSEIRSRLADGVLDRTDILSVLRSAGDGNVVDAVEFADLTRLSRRFLDLNAAPAARSSDFVGNLLSKVVLGDRANANYKGQTLGNLAAGSTKARLDALIDKWFLGGDRPETSFVYVSAAGRLVRSGMDYKDISQGAVQDGSFLASLAVAARSRSETLSQMFIDNRDGTYTVRFFRPDQTADYVTVDRFLPSDPESGGFAYAKQYFTLGGERGIDDSENELWVALAEKAYAQWLASGWVSSQITSNRYSNLALVSAGSTMASILGQATQQLSVTTNTFNSLGSNNEFGRPLVFVSKASYRSLKADVLANQSYTFLEVATNATTGERRYRFFNPWGNLNQLGDPNDPNSNLKPGEIEMTAAEVVANFEMMYLSA